MKAIVTKPNVSNEKNFEIFRFFEKSTKHRTSTSPKTNQNQFTLKMPLKRTTRLKSEVFLNNICTDLPDGEYDITKEDFLSSKDKIAPLTTKKDNSLKYNKNNEKHETFLEADFASSGKNVINACKKPTICPNDVKFLKKTENSTSNRKSKKQTNLSNKSDKNIVEVKLPLKRSARLKSAILVDNICTDLPDVEYDITKDFISSKKKLTPLTKNKANSLKCDNRGELQDAVLDRQFPSNVQNACKESTIVINGGNILKKAENSTSKSSVTTPNQIERANQQPKKRKTSPKKTDNVLELKIPLKRSTRLKSEIFVDNICTDLKDVEYGLTKNFVSLNEKIAPLTTKKIDSLKCNNRDDPHDAVLDRNITSNATNAIYKRMEPTINTNGGDILKKPVNSTSKSAVIALNQIEQTNQKPKTLSKKCDKNIFEPKMPQKRSTRLKSVIFVENMCTDLKDSKYITKDFVSSNEKLTQLTTKITDSLKCNNRKELHKGVLDKDFLSNGKNLINECKESTRGTKDGKILKTAENSIPRAMGPKQPRKMEQWYEISNKLVDEIRNTESVQELETATQATLKAKKRGRKSVADIANNRKSTVNHSEDRLNTPKIRRLSTIENSELINNNKSVKNINENENLDVEVPVQKKKRGRPRKIVERKNLEPKKRGRPRIIKLPKVVKHSRMVYTKLNELTEEPIKNVRERNIPKNRLGDELNMLDDDDNFGWKNENMSCNISINHSKDRINTQKSRRLSTTRNSELSNNKSVKNINENENVDVEVPVQKKKRGRPRKVVEKKIFEPKKRGRPRIIKPPKVLKHSRRGYTKLNKLTKEQIKNANKQNIPKNRLDDILNMIDDDDHFLWKNQDISCNVCINLHWDSILSIFSDQHIKLKYARQFLLRRDWIGLSKVLLLTNLNSRNYFPLLCKYGALLMAHTDKEQFNKIIQFLTSAADSSFVMDNCTQIPKGV